MNKFILSVEDDDAAHCILELAFRDLGPDFRLYRVINGNEALKFLARKEPFADAPRPDLILSNLNMPGMSGTELLGELRKDEHWRDIPVVVFSSSRLDSDRAECIVRGAKEFIAKPNTYQGVLGAIRTACSYIDGTIKATSP